MSEIDNARQGLVLSEAFMSGLAWMRANPDATIAEWKKAAEEFSRASSSRAEVEQAVPDDVAAALKEAIELRIKLYQNGCDCGPQHTCNAAQKDPYASKWAKVLAAAEAPKQ